MPWPWQLVRDDHVLDRGATGAVRNEARRDGVGPQGRAVSVSTRVGPHLQRFEPRPGSYRPAQRRDRRVAGPRRTKRLGAVCLGHRLHPGFHDRDAIDHALAKLHDHR